MIEPVNELRNVLPQGVIVTGATGWIGGRVASTLSMVGIPVIGIGRRVRVGPWVGFLETDLTTDQPLHTGDITALLNRARSWSLVHCAGLAHTPIETPEICRSLHAVNCLGTKRVLALCESLNISRVLYLSSIAVYDWTSSGTQAPRKEGGPLGPSTAYATSKLAGEEVVRQAGVDWQIVRLATVFGEGDRANFFRLATALRDRRFVVPGRGDARKSVISIDLAAECLATLALSPAVGHRVLNLSLTNCPTLGEICRDMCEACGFRAPHHVPLGVLRAIACAGDAAKWLGLPAAVSSFELRKLMTTTAVDSSVAADLFPVLHRTTFQRAIQTAAHYYRTVPANP